MLKLVVIADDLTGALDSGVKFAKRGIGTRVAVGEDAWRLEPGAPEEVMVICAPTRHMPPSAAYDTVFRLTERVAAAGVPYLYKKTDSVLRGNIGSELEALLTASGGGALPFIPAFPALGRVTRGGIQLFNGVPISQTVFRDDPLNPVTVSSVPEIIAAQSSIPVSSVPADGTGWDLNGRKILVIDAATQKDIFEIADRLDRLDRLHVTAGCAGFAAALQEKIPFRTLPVLPPEPSPAMVVACGSVNPVTQRQLDYAQGHGFLRLDLTVDQKDHFRSYMAHGHREDAQRILRACAQGRSVIFGTRYLHPLQGGEEARVEVMIAAVLHRLLDLGLDLPLFVVGGDTLIAFLEQIGCDQITPLYEVSEGIVYSTFRYRGKACRLLSKSGGFGGPDILPRLLKPPGTV